MKKLNKTSQAIVGHLEAVIQKDEKRVIFESLCPDSSDFAIKIRKVILTETIEAIKSGNLKEPLVF